MHGYGDICQSVTELATQTAVPISVEEFHTFNRLLDSAIADAVSSYGSHREASVSAEWRSSLGDEQRRLLATALKAFVAFELRNSCSMIVSPVAVAWSRLEGMRPAVCALTRRRDGHRGVACRLR